MLINAPDKPLRLKQTVAGNSPMDGGDAVAAKEALWRTGDYTPPFGNINEIPERQLISGIRKFQNRNGLREDGEMNPNGPTERLLRASIGQSGNRSEADQLRRVPIAGTVGANGRNNPQDKQTLKSMLTLTGQFDPDSPPEDENYYLSAAIRNLQSEFNLPRTSTLTPGDDASKKLQDSLDLYADGDFRDLYRTPLPEVEPKRVQVAQADVATSDADTDSTDTFHDVPIRPETEPDGIKNGTATSMLGRISDEPPTVPDYRKEAVPQAESDAWYKTLTESGIGVNLRNAYLEFYIAEGGEKLDRGPDVTRNTYAGITEGSLNQAIKDNAVDVPEGTLPQDLTQEQRTQVLNHLLGKKGDSRSLGKVTGRAEALERIEDQDAAAALVDVILVPHDADTRIKMVQDAINDVSPGRVEADTFMGDETFDAYTELANDPETRRRLLDALADRRIESKRGEPDFEGYKKRFDYFCFSQKSGKKEP